MHAFFYSSLKTQNQSVSSYFKKLGKFFFMWFIGDIFAFKNFHCSSPTGDTSPVHGQLNNHLSLSWKVYLFLPQNLRKNKKKKDLGHITTKGKSRFFLRAFRHKSRRIFSLSLFCKACISFFSSRLSSRYSFVVSP